MKADELILTCMKNGAKNAYKILVGEPKRKTQFGRPQRGWEDDLKNCFLEDGVWLRTELI
jgi:hypothetical protein